MRSSLSFTLLPALLLALGTGCGAGFDTEVEEITDVSDALSTGRFEVFTGQDGQKYFHLLAGNGEKVLASEGYTEQSSALEGIASVRTNGADPAQYQIRQTQAGESYVVLVARNGEVIGTGELYASLSNAQRAIDSMVRIVASATGPFDALPSGGKIQLFKGLDGRYYFHLRALNGQIVLQSQGYVSRTGALNGIASVKTNGGLPERYQVVAHDDGTAHFVLRAANGQIIGVGETYASVSNAQRGIDTCLELLTTSSGAN